MQRRYTLSSELQVAKHAECTRLFCCVFFLQFLEVFHILLFLFAPLFELGRFYHDSNCHSRFLPRKAFLKGQAGRSPSGPPLVSRVTAILEDVDSSICNSSCVSVMRFDGIRVAA